MSPKERATHGGNPGSRSREDRSRSPDHGRGARASVEERRRGRLDLQGRLAGPRDLLRHGYRRKSDYEVSITDPDAALMQHKRGASRLGYHAHYVADGGKARVVLSVLVTPADVMEKSGRPWKVRAHAETSSSESL